MKDNFTLLGSICKVTPTDDGGREVQGYATLEVPDKSGEIIDWNGTKKAFEKWSNDFEEKTGGKSKGNMRLMHNLDAVGKVSGWKPVTATVKDDDGEDKEVNAIWLNSYVPSSHPEVIKDLDEGVLTGYSIGGSYAKGPIYDSTAKAKRYTPEIAEVSYVDNPCVPGADLKSIIAKAATQKGESMAEIPTRNDLTKAAKAFDGSFEAIQDAIQKSFAQKWPAPNGDIYNYPVKTFPDKVIIFSNNRGDSKYFEIPYSIDKDGNVTLGDATEVEQVEQYIPTDEQKAIEAKIKKTAADAKTEREKLHDEAEQRAKKYGIGVKDGGALTPPKGKPTSPDGYGDPTNYAYPIDSEHIKPAVSYFNQDGQQKDGGYTDAEWAIIGKRVAAAAQKLEDGGKKYSYSDGKIEIKEDKQVDNKSAKDIITDAAKAAGISSDAVTKLLDGIVKATVNKDKDSNLENVDGKDGDKADGKKAEKDSKAEDGKGGKKTDGNKPGDDGEDSDGEDDGDGEADEKTKNAAKKAGMSDEMLKAFTSELKKAGKSISSISEKHIKAIKALSDACTKADKEHNEKIKKVADALLTTPMADDELTSLVSDISPVDTSGDDGFADVTKAVANELGKAGLSDMKKAMSAMPELQKAVESANETLKKFDDVQKTLDEMKKAVQEIHDTPVSGGPIQAIPVSNIDELVKSMGVNPETINKSIDSITDNDARNRARAEIVNGLTKAAMAQK